MQVTIGTDKFMIAPNQGVSIPAGVPHASNPGTSETRVFEAIAPGASETCCQC